MKNIFIWYAKPIENIFMFVAVSKKTEEANL